jgi:hypothetical protein
LVNTLWLLDMLDILLLLGEILCRIPRWITSASRVNYPGTWTARTGIASTPADTASPNYLFSGTRRIIHLYLFALTGVYTPVTISTDMR